jgi:hypothetical protein
MESYRIPGYPAPLGDLAYVAALALFIYLQRLSLLLRAEEEQTWWASNGRDVVNGAAVVTLSAAIWLQGVAPWLAIFFGGTLILTLTVLHAFLQRRHPQPWKPLVVAAALLGAPLVLAPQPVAEKTASLLQAAFAATF